MTLNLYSRIVFIIIFLFAFYTNASAQSRIDSLRNKWHTLKTTEDTQQYYRAIANAFGNDAAYDSAIANAKKSLEYVTSSTDSDFFGRAHLFIGYNYMSLNQNDSAFRYLMKSKEYLKNSKETFLIMQVNHSLAYIYGTKSDAETAGKYYKENIELYKKNPSVRKEYVDLAYTGLLGGYYFQLRYDSTVSLMNEYLQFVHKEYPEKLGGAYQQVGSVYRLLKDNTRSIQNYRTSLEYFQGDGINTAYTQVQMAVVFLSLEQYDSAKKYLNIAESNLEPTDQNEAKVTLYNCYASVLLATKEYDRAEEYILKAIELTPEEYDLYNVSLLWTIRLTRLTEENVDIKNNPEKLKELNNITEELAKNFEKIQNTESYISYDLKLHNYSVLAKAYEELGQYDLAYENLKRAVELKDSVYGTSIMKDLANAQAQIDIDIERNRVMLEEETKRIQLQKDIELKALRFEYEKKQAAAKTEEERKRLLLEEELKRQEIELIFEKEQEAITIKYEGERKLSELDQKRKEELAKAELQRTRNIRNMSLIGAGLASLLLGIAVWSYFQKRKDNKHIADEKQKSEDLLLNILPHEVAEELKESGRTSVKHFDKVSVIFTDFVNFTAHSEHIGAEAMLKELNVNFTAFDHIMERHGLEKIKTIGDAYLAVCGLPLSQENHAKRTVDAALDIIQFVEERKKISDHSLNIRIGIHSGPLVAGIVGVKKFAYDIWGDTVNTAARMEQSSEPGRVNISESTYELVKDDYTFEPRGKIQVKGKGALEMYFVR